MIERGKRERKRSEKEEKLGKCSSALADPPREMKMPGFFCSEPVQDASDYESGPHWTGQSLDGQRTQPGRLGFCGWVVGLRIQAVSRDAVQSRESMMLRV